MNGRFQRRIYHSWGQLWHDLRQLMGNRHRMRSDLVSLAFRERLMLIVTEVNGCRYCSYFHAKVALEAGLTAEETREYLQGDTKNAPAQELPALLYAQHWAAYDAEPDQLIRQGLFETYGKETAEAIEAVLNMIRMGNLLGNLGDYLIFKFSFGHAGLLDEEKSSRPTIN